MQWMEGKVVAEAVYSDLRGRVALLKEKQVLPGLGTILVGEDPASQTYIGAKHKACEAAGVRSVHRQMPATATQKEIVQTVQEFNANPQVHAFIVQLPLPRGIDQEAVLAAIAPAKDADGLHPVNLGRLVMGTPGPLPCTPHGILRMLMHYQVSLEGRHVVIVGRGLTIGRPLALLLSLKRPHCNAAVTVVHTGVKDMAAYTRQADVLIVAAGSPGMITRDMVRPGAVVVGAGLTREGNRIVSDVDDNVAEVAELMTPRVGGVGPMTVAMLLANTVAAAEAQH